MNYVDQILYEFDGQLSISDIYHLTYKEIGYMRKHRKLIKKARGGSSSLEKILGGSK